MAVSRHPRWLRKQPCAPGERKPPASATLTAGNLRMRASKSKPMLRSWETISRRRSGRESMFMTSTWSNCVSRLDSSCTVEKPLDDSKGVHCRRAHGVPTSASAVAEMCQQPRAFRADIVILQHTLTAGCRHGGQSVVPGLEAVDHGPGESLRVAGRDEPASMIRTDQFGNAGNRSGDHGTMQCQ